MYKDVFEKELTLLSDSVRAKAPTHVPMVLSNQEATAIINELKSPYHLMFSLLYGCGLRKAELLRLCIKDIDFGGNSICTLPYPWQTTICLLPIASWY